MFLSKTKKPLTFKGLGCFEKIVGGEDAYLKLSNKVRHLNLPDSDINNEQLKTILRRYVNLETLDLSWRNTISTFALFNQSNIQTLILKGWESLTAPDLSNQPNLQTLNLSQCTNLATLDLSNQSNLQTLDMRGAQISQISISPTSQISKRSS